MLSHLAQRFRLLRLEHVAQIFGEDIVVLEMCAFGQETLLILSVWLLDYILWQWSVPVHVTSQGQHFLLRD